MRLNYLGKVLQLNPGLKKSYSWTRILASTINQTWLHKKGQWCKRPLQKFCINQTLRSTKIKQNLSAIWETEPVNIMERDPELMRPQFNSGEGCHTSISTLQVLVCWVPYISSNIDERRTTTNPYNKCQIYEQLLPWRRTTNYIKYFQNSIHHMK